MASSCCRYHKKPKLSCANIVKQPVVIVMVGLPARGKTYIAKKMARYFNWIGINTKVFNVGEYRRANTQVSRDHAFFDPENEEAMKIRRQCAKDALDDMALWFDEQGGEVAMKPATRAKLSRKAYYKRYKANLSLETKKARAKADVDRARIKRQMKRSALAEEDAEKISD